MKTKRPAKFGETYTDEELIAILSDAPTQSNVIKHALRLERIQSAIHLVYKHAMTATATLKKRGWSNKTIDQTRRVAKKRVGWIS